MVNLAPTHVRIERFLYLFHFQVITRMNILVAVLCLIMGRPYQFYYFVPLVSFWFVVIYAVIAMWPRVTAALVKGERFCLLSCSSCQTRVAFIRVSKVICVFFDFAILRFIVIGLKKLAPLSQPIRRKTKSNHNSLAHVFPRFLLTTCSCFEF